MFSKVFPKIHTEGYKFIVIAVFVTIILLILNGFLGLIGLLLTIWMYYFFRDPERVIINDDNLKIYNSKSDSFQAIRDELWKEVESNFNEVLLLDTNAEGGKQGFNFEVLKYVKFPIDRIIISGGITKNDIKKAKKIGLAGVSIDNFVLHSEYSIRAFR